MPAQVKFDESTVANKQTVKDRKCCSCPNFAKQFKQQELPAWQPLFTPSTVFPTFIIIGLIMLAIGGGLLYIAEDTQEVKIDYTQCLYNGFETTCAEVLSKNISQKCVCMIPFTLLSDFNKQIYFYYAMENYHQNLRRYESSVDNWQLLGSTDWPKSTYTGWFTNDFCSTFRARNVDGQIRPIVPCGAIANSFFNDSFTLYYLTNTSCIIVPMVSDESIIWEEEMSKFQNPEWNISAETYPNFTNPPYWGDMHLWDLDPGDPSNNGFFNKHLINWMRVSAFPRFRKLYAVIQHESGTPFEYGLPAGYYYMLIDYAYPVKAFGGVKRMIFTNTTWLGGKNNFLGIAYIIFGCILLLSTAILFLVYKKYGSSPSKLIIFDEKTPYFTTGKIKIGQKFRRCARKLQCVEK